jgi:hypothetical protein
VCVRDEPARRDEPEAADGAVLRALAGGVVALGSSPVAPVTGAPTAGPFDAAAPSVAPAAGAPTPAEPVAEADPDPDADPDAASTEEVERAGAMPQTSQ